MLNNIYFIIISLLCILYIINDIRKKRFTIKESFWWVIASIIMLFLAIFPYSIDWLAHKFGISYPPSLLFVFCILFLIFMNFKNNKEIAKMQTKIVELSQQVSILKEEVKENISNEKK